MKVNPQRAPEEQIPQNQDEKRGRRAGEILFPRRSLKKSLEVANVIERDNAGDPYDPILLATKSLGSSPRSSGFEVLLSASERYGLTKGNSRAKAIELTSLGSAIVAPTDDTKTGENLRTAMLTPKLFDQFFTKYDRKNLPREEIVKNALIKEFNVPREDVDSCYEVLIQNIQDYQLVVASGENQILYLDNLGKTSSKQLTSEEPQPTVTDEPQLSLDIGAPDKIETKQIPRVFISHSKNKNILDQLETILEFGKFEYIIAEDVETAAIPIPDKIFGLMRQCNCAIINISADEELRQEDGKYRINENVLIEIGAAFVHYNKRVILLVDKRLLLPSNLQGLYRCEYEGDELSFMIAMKLQKALTEFREKI